MFCVQCGAENNGTMTACPACGHTAAGPASPEFVKRMSEATSDAGGTLKHLGANPTGALQPAFSSLGENRALGAGIALGAGFALACTIAAWIASLRMHIGFQPRVLFGTLIAGLVLFASLAVASAAGRKLLRGTGSLAVDVFLAGVALQPIAILLLLASMAGVQNFEIVLIATLLSWTYLLSILYVGVTRLSGISDAAAPPLIAGMLLLSLWISKVVLLAIAGFNPFGSTF